MGIDVGSLRAGAAETDGLTLRQHSIVDPGVIQDALLEAGKARAGHPQPGVVGRGRAWPGISPVVLPAFFRQPSKKSACSPVSLSYRQTTWSHL